MTSTNSLDPSFASIMAHPNAAARVPKIRILRKQLGYGDETLGRCQAFIDDMRVFRKLFVTKGGVQGHNLYEWRSNDDRLGLTEMTLEYLEVHGNGAKFWPDDKASHFYNKLQYSTHHGYIKRNVLMLLWRLNLQGHRNSKHKAKIRAERSHEEDTTRRRKRASRKAVPTGSTSSDANSMAPSNSHRSPPQQSNTTVPYVRATFRAVDDEPIAPTAPFPPMQFEPTMDSQNQTSDANTSQWQNEDHSGLPNIQESAITGGRAIFRVLPRSRSPAGDNRSADETNNERPAKRTKGRHEPETEHTEYARKKPGPLKTFKPVKSTSVEAPVETPSEAVSQRWSSRARTKRQIYGAATPEQLAQALEPLSEDDESSEESGSEFQRKLMVNLNTKPGVPNDSSRDPITKISEGAVPGTLGETRETVSSTQIRGVQATQRQRDLMPSPPSKEQATLTPTPVQPQPEAATTPSRQAGNTHAAQPGASAAGCLPQDLPASTPAQNGPLIAASASPQAPSATATAGQTLPLQKTVTASMQEAPAQEAPAEEDPAEEDPAQGDPAQEDPAQEDPAQEDPAQEDPAQEDPAQEDPAQEDPAQEDPAQEDPAQGDPAQGDPAQEDSAQEAPVSGASSLPLIELAAASARQTVEHEVQGACQQHEDDTVNSTGQEVLPSSPSRERTQTPPRASKGPQRETQGPEGSPGRTRREESLALPPQYYTQTPSRVSPMPVRDSPSPTREFGGFDGETPGQERSPRMIPPHESLRPSTIHIHARYESVLDEEFGGNEVDMEWMPQDGTDTEVQDEQPETLSKCPGSPEAASQPDRVTAPSMEEPTPRTIPPHEPPRPSTMHIHARHESVWDEEFGGTEVGMEWMPQDGTDTEVQDEQPETLSRCPGSPEAASKPDRATAPSMEVPTAPLSENVAKGPPQESLEEHMPWLFFTRAATEPPRSRQEAKRVSGENPRCQTINIDASVVPPTSTHAVNPASPPQPLGSQGSMAPPPRTAVGMHAREAVGGSVPVSYQEMGEKNEPISEQERLPKQNASTQKPALGKPNIRVLYSVILSRNPVLQCRDWKPKGAFRDKMWSQLREEIPLTLGADTKGLRFRLTGPGLSTEVVVLHDEDEEFEVVKRRFERMIRACVPRGVAGGEPPIFEMEMEALTDESPTAGAGEVYDEAFAW